MRVPGLGQQPHCEDRPNLWRLLLDFTAVTIFRPGGGGGYPAVPNFEYNIALPLADTWIVPVTPRTNLSAANTSWTSLTVKGLRLAFASCVKFSSASAGPVLIVFGGTTYPFQTTFEPPVTPIVSPTVYKFDGSLRWSTITQYHMEGFDSNPLSLVSQSVFSFGQEIFFFGGFNTFTLSLSRHKTRAIAMAMASGLFMLLFLISCLFFFVKQGSLLLLDA